MTEIVDLAAHQVDRDDHPCFYMDGDAGISFRPMNWPSA